MSSGHEPVDTPWSRLTRFAAHELSNPLGAVAGYIRMLNGRQVGELTDMQRRILQEAEKSCARLKSVVDELRQVARLEAQEVTFSRAPVDLIRLLETTIAALPPYAERDVTITLRNGAAGARVEADAVRLQAALTAILVSLRREVWKGDALQVSVRSRAQNGRPSLWIAIAEDEQMAGLEEVRPEDLGPFNECRGGAGLSLTIARQILLAHGGALWAPQNEDAKTSAVVALPAA